MGNKVVINNYKIEDFLQEVEEKELNQIQFDQLSKKLEAIDLLFASNPNVYKIFKKNEDDELDKKDKDKANRNNEDRLTTKFCRIITKIINLNFQSNYFGIYLSEIKIMSYLILEPEFINELMKNSIEKISNMIITNDAQYKDELKLCISIYFQ